MVGLIYRTPNGFCGLQALKDGIDDKTHFGLGKGTAVKGEKKENDEEASANQKELGSLIGFEGDFHDFTGKLNLILNLQQQSVVRSGNVFSDLQVGRVYQNLSHSLCHAIRFGGDVSRCRRSSLGKSDGGSDSLSGRGENGGDGVQPVGGLVDRSEESADGGAVDSCFQNDRVCDDGGRRVGFGGWSVDFESALSDVEPGRGGDCLFLFPDKEIHVGIAWVSGVGIGDGSCGGVAGGERSV